MTFLCVRERASFKITLIWSDLEENRWIFEKEESGEVLISPNMPHKTFSGFDAANCQPQNHFPILFLYSQCFKVSQKSRRCRSCKPFPHQSESGPNQFAKYVQHNSIQWSRDFMFYVHIPKEERASINTQYVLIFLVWNCSKKRCSYMLVLGHGLGLVHRRWFAVCATDHIFSAYRQDTVARPAWATLKRKAFITPM